MKSIAQILFQKAYDVVVVGAGVAGVAAALASARKGRKTALIEKTIAGGGLATIGNVLIYLPLSDARGRQLTFGIAEELLHLSLRYGPGRIPADWNNPETKSRYGSRFSPASFILALDELLVRNGVDIWFDTLVCESVITGNRLQAVEVENKSGRGLLSARCFVDASGDADVAFRAGAPCAEQDNFVSIWALEIDAEKMNAADKNPESGPFLRLRTAGGTDIGEGLPPGIRKYSGTRGSEVSEFVLTGRRLLLDQYKKAQAAYGEEGRFTVFPLTLPAMADFRTTRRIEGLSSLRTGDEGKHFDDCVGLVSDWRDGSKNWGIPYGALLPQKIKGLLAAGRCCAAAGQAWEVFRVIQAAAMTGEVCGTAAALAVELNTSPDALAVKRLQEELEAKGFALDIRDFQ
jgi:hypothetical protein